MRPSRHRTLVLAVFLTVLGHALTAGAQVMIRAGGEGALFLREERSADYFEWLERKVTAEPDRKIFYDVGFRLNQALHRPEECEVWMRRWQQRSGASDPSMAAALLREQQRADEAARGGTEEE